MPFHAEILWRGARIVTRKKFERTVTFCGARPNLPARPTMSGRNPQEEA
jgi:hypothetical protein